jgi:subtilisin family serine protease
MIYGHPTVIPGKRSKNPTGDRWYEKFIPYQKVFELVKKLQPTQIWLMDDTAVPTNSDLMHCMHEIWEFTDENFESGDHGHHCAGIIASSKYGLFTNIKIGFAKVLKSQSGQGFSNWIIDAIVQGKNLGYRVMSASLGADKEYLPMKNAIIEYLSGGEIKKRWWQFWKKPHSNTKNFFVCAAGNDGKDTDYPAVYAKEIPGVISVGAADIENDKLKVAFYSSIGVVTFIFPGSNILSTLPNDEFGYMSGTSMATPFAAGLIATCIAINPNFDFKMFVEIAMSCCYKISGDKQSEGLGFVDVLKFLQTVSS